MPAVASVAGLPSRLGKYELLMPLAAGGMARIYIGRSTGIGSFERHVVLKLITPERANDQTAVQMFLDEARLAASLNHQNVAQVFEVGEDSNIHYLAMEYVHGQDLRALLAKAGSQGTRIPLELALTVVAGAAAGLNHAHERRSADGTPMGIVHRDVSPSNIMIGYDGAVKLLDFGIAKAAARSVETQSGIIKGKFAYMAPEQCRGREVDRRSDVFSLGIILYEISTQHRCFRADSDFDTMHRIVTGDVVRPTRLVQGYPQALEAIVMKALAVDANQRYQSAGLLLEAIESFAVSSRMSLSTMGLGRVMRDMFGEIQEPWLSGPMKAPVVAKETTISSTNSTEHPRLETARSDEPPSDMVAPEPPREMAPESSGAIEEEGRFQDSGGIAAKTVLDLPGASALREELQNPVDWNAKSYPSTPPSVSSSSAHDLPPQSIVMRPTPPSSQPAQRPSTPARGVSASHVSPHVISAPARGSQPMPTQAPVQATPPRGQFAQSQGSGTGPSMPAAAAASASASAVEQPKIVSTRHGYSSGAMTGGAVPAPMAVVKYAQYGAGDDDLDVQLRSGKRTLIIGVAILLAGIIAVIVLVSRGGEKDDLGTQPNPNGSAEPTAPTTTPTTAPATTNATTPETTKAISADLIAIHVASDPKGADVILAGTKIGTTPFDGKLKRGTKSATLVVHKDGFVDFTAKIDLAVPYSNDTIALVATTSDDAAKPKTDGKATAKGDTATDTTPPKPDDATPANTDPAPKADASKATTDKPKGDAAKADDKPKTDATVRPKSNTHTVRTPPKTDTTPPTPPKPAAPKCQQPSSINPFDTSCDGKPCPVCKP